MLFGARHFRTAQAAAYADFYALSAGFYCARAGLLQSLAERTAVYQLARDALRNKCSVDFRAFDFFDFNLNLFRQMLLDFRTDFFDIGTFNADNNSGARRMNNNGNTLRMTHNFNIGDIGIFALRQILNHFSDFQIFEHQIGIFARIRIPAGLPRFIYSQTQSDRVYFLSHFIPPPFQLRQR